MLRSLNIPPFRSSLSQCSSEDEIAKLWIHVERSIVRVKNVHIFDGIHSLSLLPLASQISDACC